MEYTTTSTSKHKRVKKKKNLTYNKCSKTGNYSNECDTDKTVKANNKKGSSLLLLKQEQDDSSLSNDDESESEDEDMPFSAID